METEEKKLILSDIYTVIIEVENALSAVVYNYISEEDYQKIDNIPELQLVYWSEIIQRLHICGATTIQRLKKWYEAINNSYETKNYYGFCASIRGLIEACSDSFFTLSRVIFPIAENFKHINEAIKGNAQRTVLSEEIEDYLIHYIFAQKLRASERRSSPQSHSAKQVREYLDSLDDDSINQLYAEMCQVSHPSKMSLIPFIMELEEHGLSLHKKDIDEELNKNLLDKHRDSIYNATAFALGTAQCSLKLINLFEGKLLESLQTDDSAFLSLDGNKLWEDIETKIKESLNS